jgi:hypothetical protein
MKKLASFGQETPKQTIKTPATQQSTELIITALQSNHFMENPKPEIACKKKLAPFGQANPKQNDEVSNNPTIHLNLLSELFRGTTSWKTQNQKLLE